MLQLRQSQSLQQRLTPQQVQYLKLLQLPILALEQRIKSELEENPMLEESSDEEEREDQPSDDTPAESVEMDAAPELERLSLPIDDAQDVTAPDLSSERLLQQTRENEERLRETQSEPSNEYTIEDYMNDDTEGFKTPTANNADDDREEIPRAASESFLESLYTQVTMLNLPDRYRALAEEIVGSIDADGYLRVPLEQIAHDTGISFGEDYTTTEAEAVLRKIQKLDPVGVAARDLRECLGIQLDVMPNHSPTREVARRIIRERFDDFVNKRFTALARHLSMEVRDMKPAIELIQHLNPKPGAAAGDTGESTNYITADFYIEKTPDGKDFTITLNERGVPTLRVNATYKDLIRKQTPEHGKGRTNGAPLTPEAKDFIKKKFEAAKFFIMAIYQRRETMMRVMHSIVHYQRAFFEQGEKFLKPLIYKTIAEDIGMDISTICRVVNGKYCQSDFGVFELKYFFSEAIPTHLGDSGENSNGEAVANKVVKFRIKEIIDSESGGEPLSDESIVHLLNGEGFDVARRTIAKYREQMNIPVARLRKKLM